MKLITHYSVMFHNMNIKENELHSFNVEMPQDRATFSKKLNTLCKRLINDNVPTPPTLFMVNTHNGKGKRWYTVALELKKQKDISSAEANMK